MQDKKKTKAQLIEDLTRLRQRLMAVERRETERSQEPADTRAELTEALARQMATSDILRLIASSPTDVQPVFDAIAASATTLCEAENGGVYRRQMVRQMLEREGYAVVEADHGQQALVRVAEQVPELILLDLLMPEMDGFQFVEELYTHEEWRSIPIVIVTARDLTEEDRLRLNGYVEQILQKGMYSREALLAEVRQLVATRLRRKQGGET
jgi:CheY-like chemotaxis protein